MNNFANFSQAFDNFDFSEIFCSNQDEDERRFALYDNNAENSPVSQSLIHCKGLEEMKSSVILPEVQIANTNPHLSKDYDHLGFCLTVIDNFNLLIANEMFSESKALLDPYLTRESKEYRIFSLSLLRLQFFNASQISDSIKASAMYLKIKSYDDDFTINNGYLDFLAKNQIIFQTSFYSQKKMKVYLPAIKQIALYLLGAEGLLPDYDFPLVSSEDSFILMLEHIEEEMTYYMIIYQRIFESTGEFNEILLNFNASFNRNDPSIARMIYDFALNQHNVSSNKKDVVPSKRSIYEVIKENSDIINSAELKKQCCGSLTIGSDETSEKSKEALVAAIPFQELYAYEFSGVEKQFINQKILRIFKRFIKLSTKSKRTKYSNEVYAFSNNNLKSPLGSNGIQLKRFNQDYMHWLFTSNEQLVSLYEDFITQCSSYVFDKVIKDCNIAESDTLYLRVYINKFANIYCCEQPILDSAPKKDKKIAKNIKSSQQSIFKIERLPQDVKRSQTFKNQIVHEDADNNYETTDDISNLLSDVYHELEFN